VTSVLPADIWPALRRTAYRAAVSAATLAALPTVRRDGRIAVHFGGARSGAAGGPLVKAGQLRARFGEARSGFSILYLLSNALYVGAPVLALARRAGAAVVVNQNGVFYPAWYPDGWQRENARMAAAHRHADHVIYQSEFCRRAALRFLGVEPRAWQVLPNAVDVERFAPRPAGTGPCGGQFRFLVTGKIGPSTAYRLWSTLDGLAVARRGGLDVALTVAGHLDDAVAAEAARRVAAAGLGDAVALAGPFSRAEAPELYRAADAYIITKHNDPCPNVVLEALASGLPVLYSASGGVPELVGDAAGVGLMVPDTFEDTPVPAPLAIAEGMAAIVAGREVMAAAARARAVAMFALDGWLDRHAALFRALAGARAHGGPA
jgi:glycosyltransferase involved in cell wall biosynthesis